MSRDSIDSIKGIKWNQCHSKISTIYQKIMKGFSIVVIELTICNTITSQMKLTLSGQKIIQVTSVVNGI